MRFVIFIILNFLQMTLFVSAQNTIFNKHNKEEDPEFHRQRKAWLQDMHRTEPGVNYKVLQNEILHKKMSLMNKVRKNIDLSELQKYVSDNGKVSGVWKERGSKNLAGRIHTADVDLINNIVYAASSGGNVWQGYLNGDNWKCLNNSAQFNIQNIKVENINNNKRIFVFDASYLYYSDNEGFTWEKAKGLEIVANWGNIMRGMVINDNNSLKIYVLTNEWDYDAWVQIRSLYFSNDNGQTFEKVLSVSNTENIDIWGYQKSIGEYFPPEYSNNFNKLIFVHQDSIFSVESTNVNLLNTCEDIKISNPGRIRIAGTNIKDQIYLYINVTNKQTNKLNIFLTDDFGKKLQFKSQSPTTYFMNNSFSISKINPNFAMIGGVEGYTTNDFGKSWMKINGWGEYYQDPQNKLHADIPGVSSFRTDKDKEFFLICTDGGIYKTKENFLVDNLSLSGLNVSQYYSIYTYYDNNEELILAGSQDQGFQVSENFSDRLLNFTQTISGDYGSLSSGNGGKSLWCVYPGFAMFYTDINFPQNRFDWYFTGSYTDRVWMPPIVAVPGSPNTAYCASGGTPNGSKITKLNYSNYKISPNELPYRFDANDAANDVSSLGISEINPEYLYAATKIGKFYSSTDAGNTWKETPNFGAPGYNYLHGTCILASKKDLGTVYVTGSGYSSPAIFVSYDNGQNFEAIEGLPPCLVYQIDLTPEEDVIFAATSIGPYLYIKNHKRWYDIAGPDAPDQNYWSVNYLPWKKTVRFATYGRGIWDFEIENLVTNVKDDELNSDISELTAYPNPATDVLNISFNANIGEFADLKIVDIDGKLIHNCFENTVISKNNNISLNLNNFKNIVSGTYLVMLTTNNMLKYKKINIIR